MHRPSASENPQSPLSHHYLDSTHVTPGVVSIGVERAGFGVEAGAFHGQEPDEDRLDLDTAALDSYSVRAIVGGWAVAVPGLRRSPEDARAQVAVRRERADGVGVVFQGRRAAIDRVAGGIRTEPRRVRQSRSVSVRSAEARRHATRSTRAPRPSRRTSSMPAFIRSASSTRIASRRSAR